MSLDGRTFEELVAIAVRAKLGFIMNTSDCVLTDYCIDYCIDLDVVRSQAAEACAAMFSSDLFKV